MVYLVNVKLNGVLDLFLKILLIELKLLCGTRMLILTIFSSTFKLLVSAFVFVISGSLFSFKADIRLISGWSELLAGIETEPVSPFFSPKMLGMVNNAPPLPASPRWEEARLLREGVGWESDGEERQL